MFSTVHSFVLIGGRYFTAKGVGRTRRLFFGHARWVPDRTIGTIGSLDFSAKCTKPFVRNVQDIVGQ